MGGGENLFSLSQSCWSSFSTVETQALRDEDRLSSYWWSWPVISFIVPLHLPRSLLPMVMVHYVQTSATWVVCTCLHLDIWISGHCLGHHKSLPAWLFPSGTVYLSPWWSTCLGVIHLPWMDIFPSHLTEVASRGWGLVPYFQSLCPLLEKDLSWLAFSPSNSRILALLSHHWSSQVTMCLPGQWLKSFCMSCSSPRHRDQVVTALFMCSASSSSSSHDDPASN